MSDSDPKGKAKAVEIPEEDEGSSSDSDSSSGSEPVEQTPEERIRALLRLGPDTNEAGPSRRPQDEEEEDEIILTSSKKHRPFSDLDPGPIPSPYFTFGKTRFDGLLSMHDPEAERAAKAAELHAIPAPPMPPPELTKSGKPLTKKEMKMMRQKTAGPDWFDLPAPAEADLPRLYREVEALRLRNQLDPKRFYRKDEGEGKGIKGLPKYFAIGTVLPTNTPFGTATADNLARADRKRTLVEELVDDAEAKRYAKKKFVDLQSVRGAKGKNTLRAKQALRKGKW